MRDLQELESEALPRINSAETLAQLEDHRVQLLGKKGEVTELLKSLGSMDPEARKTFGAHLNQLRTKLQEALDSRKNILENAALEASLASESIDISLPAWPSAQGQIHPISKVTEEIFAIFQNLGFNIEDGPEIEDDYHNFTALNFPVGHPAREMHDTFYMNSAAEGDARKLLRTHTSTVQIRTMKAGKPPFRFVSAGRTFRCDSDMTHSPMFHQLEGVYIDRDINMGHLKGCLTQFLHDFLELDSVPVRFRSSFFPFTEPSAEVDIGCSREDGILKIGAGSDWLEVLGCGMVHPNVLINCGLDPNEWQGFAFGMGIERLAMLKYGMPDLRAFFDSDIRWLKHYGFSAV